MSDQTARSVGAADVHEVGRNVPFQRFSSEGNRFFLFLAGPP